MQERSDNVEGDWSHGNDSYGIELDGMGGQMDDATSSACSDSKQADTRPLAEDRVDQHGHNKHTTDHIPGSPTCPRKHHGRPTNNPNPPC